MVNNLILSNKVPKNQDMTKEHDQMTKMPPEIVNKAKGRAT